MFENEAPFTSQASNCWRCQNSGAFYRCTDCHMVDLQCCSCLLDTHPHAPFHHVEKWDGQHFSRSTLFNEGFEWYLGHSGSPCPRRVVFRDESVLQVMDTNGFHQVRVVWCQCARSGDVDSKTNQLLRHQVFPGSPSRLQSGFTFRALKHFHLLNLQARVTPWEWCITMSRLTDNVLTIDIPVSGVNLPLSRPVSQDQPQSNLVLEWTEL